MAEIIPFRAIRYNPEREPDLSRVIGPPYDVITPDEQTALYDLNRHNYVRVMLNRAEPSDDDRSNVYTRADAFLRVWQADGILVDDPEPALYLYEQEFTDPTDGSRRLRTGLACALKLEPYSAGVVLPHEETKPKAREDRLRLMRATEANPEPILGLYEDPQAAVAGIARAAAGRTPIASATVNGDGHRVWRVGDPAAIERIRAFLAPSRIWIADGHHRYETALAFAAERCAERGTGGAADYLLVVLSAFEDPGLVVLPTHRLVRGIPAGRLEQLNLQLERYFTVEPVRPEDLGERMAAEPGGPVHRFGRVSAAGAAVLTLRDEAVMDAAVEGHSVVWGRLDVSILQTLVLERSLGIPPSDILTSQDIGYTRDVSDAIARVHAGEYQLAFLLNRPASDEVRQVAAAGDKMPAKSTFFYPKLWSGLFLRSLRD